MTDRLLELLRGATKQGEFTLSSGKKSDWYLDCREVTLTPEGSLLAAKRLIWAILLDPQGPLIIPTVVVGPIAAACPLVTGIGIQAAAINWNELKLGYVRKEAKDHGTNRLIEGCTIDPKDHVLIVDDVATSGNSIVRCIEAIRESVEIRPKTISVLVLVDREQGARERLDSYSLSGVGSYAAYNISLRALYTRRDLV